MSRILSLEHPHGLDPERLRLRVGGKAASLFAMRHDLELPVPPAFVITTETCREYFAGGWPDGLDDELRDAMVALERSTGRRFGDPDDPLLVSVRSGAPVSMPGMMDTILNLGLNEATTAGLAAVSGDPSFAAACRERFEGSYQEIVGVEEVPDDPWVQLRGAAEAVFRSWHGARAVAYRRREGIADDMGTAATVQAMVFGNRGDASGTGVLFTRDPATGERVPYGDVLFGAQGEDVVAGTHRTEPISALDERLPAVADDLRRHAARLETHLADCADIEFTIEDGRLWMLQARVGKRSPQAALRMAIEMAEDPAFPLSRAEAVRRVESILADPPTVSGRVVDRAAAASGVAASPGVVSGEVITSCDRAIDAAEAGRRVILVRPSTAPDDVPAMARSVGILTSSGGPASHAAVVARGWGIPAVVGATDVRIDGHEVHIGRSVVRDGDVITIDGATGEVFVGDVAGDQQVMPEVATLLGWATDAGITIPGTNVEGGRSARDTTSGDQESPAPEVAPGTAVEVDAPTLLRILLIKGYATPDQLAEALGSEVAQVEPLVAALVGEGQAEAAAGAYRLTAGGKAAAQTAIEDDRTAWGAGATAALDAFLELDRRMKATVTAWQMREVDGTQALNDHADAEHDARVLEDLRTLHAETVAWLRSLQTGLPRLGRYAGRLDGAMAAVEGGDHRFVASPRVDSFHGVWFELHEDLIRLAGRSREDEVAAGRA